MTPSGNGAAIRSTKSSSPTPPVGSAPSTISPAIRSMSSRRARTARGVNPALATRRIGPCLGGSSSTRISDGGSTKPAGRSVMPCALEKRSGCFETSSTSACFVIAQNGSRPGGSNHATGASARSRVQAVVRVAVARVPLRVDEVGDVDARVRDRRGHGCTFTGFGSRGSPSRRSPTTLRWISLVPPWIELARVASSPCTHRPPSSACGSPAVSSASGPDRHRGGVHALARARPRTASPGSTPTRARPPAPSGRACARCGAGTAPRRSRRVRAAGGRRGRRPDPARAHAGPGARRRARAAPAPSTRRWRRARSRAWCWRRPSPRARDRSGGRPGPPTPSRNTSLNSLSPVIWRSGRISTPGARIGIASIEIPRCGGAPGSVRTRAIPQSAQRACDDHTFWPVTT